MQSNRLHLLIIQLFPPCPSFWEHFALGEWRSARDNPGIQGKIRGIGEKTVGMVYYSLMLECSQR